MCSRFYLRSNSWVYCALTRMPMCSICLDASIYTVIRPHHSICTSNEETGYKFRNCWHFDILEKIQLRDHSKSSAPHTNTSRATSKTSKGWQKQFHIAAHKSRQALVLCPGSWRLSLLAIAGALLLVVADVKKIIAPMSVDPGDCIT